MRLQGILLSAIIMLYIASCTNKYDSQLEDEQKRIDDYLKHVDLPYEVKDSGIIYIKVNEGDSLKVKKGDFIRISINGCILGENLIEENKDTNLYLIVGDRLLIPGVEYGLTLMHRNETARFIVPFRMAFYNIEDKNKNYNTYLFEIKVVEVIEDTLTWEFNRIKKYIADKKFNIEPDSMGFCYIPIKTGTGSAIQEGDYVYIEYIASTLDSVIFSYALQANQLSIRYKYTKIFAGLEKALSMMKVGDEALIIIPSSMAYGRNYAFSAVDNKTVIIPAYSTLLYHVYIYNKLP
jgi:FKBP-type peptidyl-prolyl cis-trans isomerase